VALRVNPDVDPQTHPYISTGLKKNKFGIDIHHALEEYKLAASLPHIEVAGCTATSVLRSRRWNHLCRPEKLVALVQELRRQGLDIRYLNLGGGLGIPIMTKAPLPDEFAQALMPLIRDLGGVTVILEPGRVIMGNAGILVTGCCTPNPARPRIL